MIGAIAAAAFMAIGSAYPVIESAFAQFEDIGQQCNNDARCQSGQTNVNGDNNADDIGPFNQP